MRSALNEFANAFYSCRLIDTAWKQIHLMVFEPWLAPVGVMKRQSTVQFYLESSG